METNKALSTDQLDQLKTSVRQRFDDLYHRIGTSRQKLATTVLLVDQAINKELTKETIDNVREKQILNKVREIEREANNQLPHVHKVVAPSPMVVKAPVVKTPSVKTTPEKTAAVKGPAAKVKTPTSKAKAKPKAKAKKK
jgi:hypothetical protein